MLIHSIINVIIISYIIFLIYMCFIIFIFIDKGLVLKYVFVAQTRVVDYKLLIFVFS